MTVVILSGGWSSEREVSLLSGQEVAAVCPDAQLLDPPRELSAFIQALQAHQPDVVFNALHGWWGEDGQVQGILNTLAIPYTHSGVAASAAAMHKPLAQALFCNAGLPIAPHRIVSGLDDLTSQDLPGVLKPTGGGSSVGVLILRDLDEVPASRDLGIAMLERYIPGREFTVGVINGEALVVTEIIPQAGFYDYTAKYTDGAARHVCPADIDASLRQRLLAIAEKAHAVLGCRGVSRADFRYDPDTETLALLEVNTQPGMTPLSLLPEQANHCGLSFEALVHLMLKAATFEAPPQ